MYYMISERLLRQFVAVAEELHFGRAAERMHIAQPAISQAIHKLETYIGVALFVRNRRGVALTHAGQVFLAQTYQTLHQTTLSIERARDAGTGSVGSLVIGFIGSAGYGYTPDIIARFRQSYPGIELKLFEMSTLEQLEQFKNRHIDIGILRTPLIHEHAYLDFHLHARDRLVAAVPSNHRFSQRKRVALADLANESFAAFNRDKVPASYAQLMSDCLTAGFQPKIAQECSQVSGLICVVAAGLGIAIVPSDLRSLKHPKVHYVDLQSGPGNLRVEISFAWRRDNHNPALRSFRAALCTA
jgi:DNA-binding transcriptional LysR family regulator